MSREPRCCACGTFLSGRAWPAGQWGTWCCRCRGWWPDAEQRPTTAPPRWLLIDGTPAGTVVESVGP
jgi:hypothetical protein